MYTRMLLMLANMITTLTILFSMRRITMAKRVIAFRDRMWNKITIDKPIKR